MSDQDNSDSFPGLNKSHGFFKAIERNQRDRDIYHKQTEERRSETHRGLRREGKRPEKGIYKPPHLRTREPLQKCDASKASPFQPIAYKLEIEVEPNQWHRENVEKVGQGPEIAVSIQERYSLQEVKRDAICKLIEEFERSLKM